MEQVSRNLMRNTDEFFQFAQIKAVLRLLRDDEGVDKDLLKYADHILSMQFNKILKSAVPDVERGKKRVGEMLAITTDGLLLALRRGRYMAKSKDELDVPFEELFYTEHEDGYILFCSDGRGESKILWTKGYGNRKIYTVECPKCDQSREAKIVKKRGEVEAIVCVSCKYAVIERANAASSSYPSESRNQGAAAGERRSVHEFHVSDDSRERGQREQDETDDFFRGGRE